MSDDNLDTRRCAMRYMLHHQQRKAAAFDPLEIADLAATEALLTYLLARQEDAPGGDVAIRPGRQEDREALRRALCRLAEAELVDLLDLGGLDGPSRARLTPTGHHAATIFLHLDAGDFIDDAGEYL